MQNLTIPWVLGRVEAVKVTMTKNCNDFCEELTSKKHIIINVAPFKELVIDLSMDTSVKFTCTPDFHKRHLIHCYILKLAQDGTVLSYFTILLLKIHEIVRLFTKENAPQSRVGTSV